MIQFGVSTEASMLGEIWLNTKYRGRPPSSGFRGQGLFGQRFFNAVFLFLFLGIILSSVVTIRERKKHFVCVCFSYLKSYSNQ